MMELQYHDKFKIRRIKFTSRKRLIQTTHALAGTAANQHGVSHCRGQFRMLRRQLCAGTREARWRLVDGDDLADARPAGGFAGIAPGRGGGDGGITHQAGRKLL